MARMPCTAMSRLALAHLVRAHVGRGVTGETFKVVRWRATARAKSDKSSSGHPLEVVLRGSVARRRDRAPELAPYEWQHRQGTLRLRRSVGVEMIQLSGTRSLRGWRSTSRSPSGTSSRPRRRRARCCAVAPPSPREPGVRRLPRAVASSAPSTAPGRSRPAGGPWR